MSVLFEDLQTNLVVLSRLVRETLDKLPLPKDVLPSVDADPYQLL